MNKKIETKSLNNHFLFVINGCPALLTKQQVKSVSDEPDQKQINHEANQPSANRSIPPLNNPIFSQFQSLLDSQALFKTVPEAVHCFTPFTMRKRNLHFLDDVTSL